MLGMARIGFESGVDFWAILTLAQLCGAREALAVAGDHLLDLCMVEETVRYAHCIVLSHCCSEDHRFAFPSTAQRVVVDRRLTVQEHP